MGSDLIILQKNSGKNGELYYNEKLFVQTEQTPIGTSVNGYVWSIGSLSHTDLIRSTDPYGKQPVNSCTVGTSHNWRKTCGSI